MGDVFVFDYHCFLSAKDRRHLNIIEYLVFKENYISVYEIEKLNQCSNRTVYNDIEEIYQRFGKQLDASFSKNVLKIRNISSGNYEQIQKKILNKSTEINVMKTVFEKSNVTVEELAK
ncbi:MAG TPA: HTH domain-containing protein, partial [Tissierellaceae bacterium]